MTMASMMGMLCLATFLAPANPHAYTYIWISFPLIKPILANEKFNTKTRLDDEGKKWKFSGLVDLSFLPYVIGCHKHELVEEEDRVGAL